MVRQGSAKPLYAGSIPAQASMEKEISWKAAEYEYREKGPGWFFVVGVVALVLFIIALIGKNFIFAVFVLFAGVMLVSFGKKRPPIVKFHINNEGVGIGNTFFEYRRLEEFAHRNRPGHLDEFILKKKTAMNPFVHIPIDSTLALEAKKMLKAKLPEVEHKESLVDVFAEWLGF